MPVRVSGHSLSPPRAGNTADSANLGTARPSNLALCAKRSYWKASKVLGISEVRLLDYPDGALDHVDPREAAAKIAAHMKRIRPHVVLTFGPEGAYGHPDHIAISQMTTAAIMYAAGSAHEAHSLDRGDPPHQVSKLYYIAWTKSKWDAYQAALKTLKAKVDGVERQATPWPDWAVTTVIDTASHWPIVWHAVSCHETQMSIYRNLEQLSDEHHRALWGSQEFYRAFSLVNGGRELETDLFEGLRSQNRRGIAA